MKILFLCHRLPFPPNRGGKIRPFHMIQHLSQKHSVVVASLAESEQELRDGAGLKEYCTELVAEVLPRTVRWTQACKALVTNTPSSVAYFCSSRLRQRIQKALLQTRFDVVFVHCAFVAQYVAGIQGGCRFLDFGDIDSGKWFDYSRWRAMPLSFGYGIEARKLRAYEREVAKHFHYCTVSTRGELSEFQTLNVPVPCEVIPNGVNIEYFTRNLQNLHTSSAVVFLGRMDYFPNIDGIVYFVEKSFPLIRQSLPEVELRIIGSNPVRKVRRLAELPGIVVTGHVPDVRPYLLDAAVSIAPLRIARGVQNKILESMAMGIPVVATPEAAKGVQAIPGQHLLVAETPERFASQIVEVLRNGQLQEKLSRAGRQQVENMYTWARSMDVLDHVLESARSKEKSQAPKADSKILGLSC
jgi:hypothetical protein